MGVYLMDVVYVEAFRFSIWGFWNESLHSPTGGPQQ